MGSLFFFLSIRKAPRAKEGEHLCSENASGGTAGVHSKLSFTPVFGPSAPFPSIQIDSSGAASVTQTFICRTHGNGGRGFFFCWVVFVFLCLISSFPLQTPPPKQLDCSAREGKKKKTHLSDKQDTVCERSRIDPAFLQLFGLSHHQVVMRSPYGSLISFIDSEKNPITSPMPGFTGADEVLKRM